MQQQRFCAGKGTVAGINPERSDIFAPALHMHPAKTETQPSAGDCTDVQEGG